MSNRNVLDETQRLKALYSLGILDTEPEERFDRITRLAARLLNVPIALVSLIDVDRQWFKSRYGLKATQTRREDAFCVHTIQQGTPFVVSNAMEDPRFRENPLVRGNPFIRFYAGRAIHTSNGSPVGTLCIIDRAPRTLRCRPRAPR